MAKDIVLIHNPNASSGLGGFVEAALLEKGCFVRCLNPLGSKWRKVWPVLRSWSIDKDTMWRRRWENMVFSSWAWDRTTRYVGRKLDQIRSTESEVLIVGKEYFPHPNYKQIPYSLFIHYTMRLCLTDGVTPWLPPVWDRPAFLERETLLYKHASTIFVGANYLADNLVNEYGVQRDRIRIAGGGAHPYFEVNCCKEIPDRFTNKIIFVGWDFGMKGGADLLVAFREVHAQRPELELLIAGPDEGQWVVQEGVRWLGQVRSKDDLIALYRQSDLFVMPSLRDSFGFVFLEAMTQGVPCIGTNLNAMPEIIEDGKTGYIVPLRDPEALAAAILRYYSDEGNRQRMGQAALERVKERYTWDRVAGVIRDA